jgi:hypothetical protein
MNLVLLHLGLVPVHSFGVWMSLAFLIAGCVTQSDPGDAGAAPKRS